jgi:hypothetical protein
MRSLPPAALACTCLLAVGCRPTSALETRKLVPELTMEGVRFQIDRGGISRARGEADRVTYRRDTTAVAATGLTLLMAGAEGQVRVSAPAASGLVDQRRFEASGGLTARRGADEATTWSATYEQPPAGTRGAGKVHGSDPVKATGPGYQLEGRGFTLDPTTADLVVGGGARLVAGLPVGK